MPISYSVALNDTAALGAATDSLLVADMNAALKSWSKYLYGAGTLTVQLNIAATTSGRADGGPTAMAPAGTAPSGAALVDPAALYELRTGSHVAGKSSDITINVDPSYVSSLFLDPNPGNGAAVPVSQLDAVSVFSHEVAHGLAFDGYYASNGTLTNGSHYETPFDTFIQKQSDGTALFVGPNVQATYGGPAPITTDNPDENYYHFGNSAGGALGQDLLNGQTFYTGTTYSISPIDRAVLRDVGYSIAVESPATTDLTGSGVSAALFTGPGGSVAFWTIQNGVSVAAASLGALDPGWSVAGTGDFHGRGTTDILFQNSSGEIAQWQMMNGRSIGATVLGAVNGAWTLQGTGDFYGAGTSDLLFRNASGALAEWQVQNGQTVGVTNVGVTDGNWTVAAIGDLHGAGASDDILFISSSDQLAVWHVQNGVAVSSKVIGQTSAYWSVVGLGDFNAGGQNDILFRGKGGEIAMWTMNNGVVTGAQTIGVTQADWQVVGVGDYNGQGTSDILFRNGSGQLAAWELSGGRVASVSSVGRTTNDWVSAPASHGGTLVT